MRVGTLAGAFFIWALLAPLGCASKSGAQSQTGGTAPAGDGGSADGGTSFPAGTGGTGGAASANAGSAGIGGTTQTDAGSSGKGGAGQEGGAGDAGAAGSSGGDSSAGNSGAGGSSAGGVPGAPALDPALRLRDLTPEQKGVLCDWDVAALGGYGVSTPCPTGGSVKNYTDRAQCVSIGLKYSCPSATVGQLEACTLAQAPSHGCATPDAECRALYCM